MILGKLPYLKGLFRRSAAKKEVIAELRQNPFGGYGLYYLMDDAGLISVNAKKELSPLMANVEQRMNLSDEDLVVDLPLKFEPLTDEEHDTLTYVIGETLRNFADNFHHLEHRLQLAAIIGISDMLEHHREDTASIDFEISLEELLLPVLKTSAKKVTYSQGLSNWAKGAYMVMRYMEMSGRLFPDLYIRERNTRENEIVQVSQKLGNGYVAVKRLNYTSNYSKAWNLKIVKFKSSRNNDLAVMHWREGPLYKLPTPFSEPIRRLVDLYLYHMIDKSYDATQYRPLRNYKVPEE